MNEFIKDFSIVGYRLPLQKDYQSIFLIYHDDISHISNRVDDYHQIMINAFSKKISTHLEKNFDNDIHHYLTRFYNNKFVVSFYMPNYSLSKKSSDLEILFREKMQEVICETQAHIVNVESIAQWDNKYLELVMTQIEKFNLEKTLEIKQDILIAKQIKL
jgi:hypothetical protein